ncbi:MAG: MBL fold metallo-hydrolase [Solirubrobacteraceae bacterium]|nr:MBL fold metallo-hydrolase [Solirubrobacteraceae bacterium]
MATRTSPPPHEALARAAEVGIHRIPLPTPFAIGDVNVHVVEGDPLTLVDCGPNSATALGALEAGLERLGHRLTDVGRVVVTHQHADHVGLVAAIVERSGAEVACLDLLAPVVEDGESHSRRDDDDALVLMGRHGVESHVAEALHSVATITRHWTSSAPVAVRVPDGGRLEIGGRDWTVHHRPGHSPSDTVLHHAGDRIAFTGDHLLARVSSNALVSRPLGEWDGRRPRPLVAYRESLRATRELDLAIALGGHGDPVVDHRTLVDERLAQQDERAARILQMLGPGPCSAHGLAVAMWGQVAVTQVYLTLSEILGHLDLLLDAGAVVEDVADDAVVLFRQA